MEQRRKGKMEREEVTKKRGREGGREGGTDGVRGRAVRDGGRVKDGRDEEENREEDKE